MDINQYFKILIQNKGLKLKKVSEMTGIEYQRLNRILNQHLRMFASEFIVLCEYLEIDPAYFKSKATPPTNTAA